ncbi:hypothetical protein EDD21DRAFT_408562 [Dissophora ornata]|nr:hypothetical protein BGZ58_003080 [Dissophora ornata]KAI8596188.1 hypothetical protein EDD21DRAFT_408562 [Dissophora ornata]
MATPSTPAGSGTAAGSQTEGETVTHIQMAGLTVLMIKTKDQVIYKLPDNMSVQSLTTDQRERLLAEINLLHHQQTTAQAIAATQAQTQQVQMAQAQALAQAQVGQGVRPIAPVGQSSAQQANGSPIVSSASTPAGNGSHRSSPSAPSTPTGGNTPDGQQKTTRRYNKTGKYSKKKLMQQQMLDRQLEAKGGITTNGQPYPKPAVKQISSTSQISQQLVFNNTSPQAFQALAAAQQVQTQTQAPGAVAGTIGVLSGIPSTILQQQLQHLQAAGLTTLDQKRQFKLLQDIHHLQQQLEIQQSSLNTFREHDQTIQRILAQNKPVDARTQQLARQNVANAEKALENLKIQMREKETSFREQFPLASQQLLLLHQQHLLATGGSATSSTLGRPAVAGLSRVATLGSALPGVPKTVEEQLQQQIAEHHDSVRNGMALELQATHRELRRPDYRTPFSSLHDAIERLLPFHVFQYPAQDIESQAKAFASRSEAELNARALSIHKQKYDLFNKYNNLIKAGAKKPTTTNPSSALDIIALRLGLDDEREEHKRISDQNEIVQGQAKILREELELRQAAVMQQRKAEAALIEQQQKLMLERLRQEELEKQQVEERQLQMMAQIRQMQEFQQQQRLEEMQEMHTHMQQQQQQQQQDSQLTEEQEAQKKKELERKEIQRQHQLELEKQMRIKQEQDEEATLKAAAASTDTAASSSSPSITTPVPDSNSSTSTPNSSSAK